MNATEYGVSQKRERVFFIGIRDNGDPFFEYYMKDLLLQQKNDAPIVRELLQSLGRAGTDENPDTCTAKITFATFYGNSILIAALATFGTIISSAIVAYGFARFKFRGKGILFSAMLLSMMLPAQVLMIPQYLWYQKLGWVGSYLPLIVPYFFATQGFFVYLISNFISGIPVELDEAAKIDGCSYWGIFVRIIVPLIKPAVVTGCIFSFMWRWDDFLSALLYVNKTSMYPVSLALKLFCDPGSSSDYGAMFAMATLSILPSVLIFIFFQKYLVEGISTSGLKG